MNALRPSHLWLALAVGGLHTALCGPASGQRPSGGVVGGPYKVLAGEFTGDGVADLILSYEPCDALTIERGDGTGHFMSLAIYQIPGENRQFIDPVYSLAQEDIDGDGLPDLAVGLGGAGKPGVAQSFPGRVVVARISVVAGSRPSANSPPKA